MQINGINTFRKSGFGARFESGKDELEFIRALKMQGLSQKQIAKTIQDVKKIGSYNTRISKTLHLPVATVSLWPEYNATEILELDNLPKGLEDAEKRLLAKTMNRAAEEGKLFKMSKKLLNDYPEKEDFILTLTVNETFEEINALARLQRMKKVSTIRKIKEKIAIQDSSKQSVTEEQAQQTAYQNNNPILNFFAKIGSFFKK